MLVTEPGQAKLRGRAAAKMSPISRPLAPALPPLPGSLPQGQADLLVRAAVSLFAARGFHAVTTRDISAAAGMSSAALYFHFRSKADLLREIVHRSHVAGLRALERAASGAGDPTERLRRLVVAQVTFNAEWRDYAHVGNFELDNLDAEDRRVILDLRRQTEALLQSAIADGLATGQFKVADIHLATTAVISLAIDVSRWFSPSRRNAREVADTYAELALRMLGANFEGGGTTTGM